MDSELCELCKPSFFWPLRVVWFSFLYIQYCTIINTSMRFPWIGKYLKNSQTIVLHAIPMTQLPGRYALYHLNVAVQTRKLNSNEMDWGIGWVLLSTIVRLVSCLTSHNIITLFWGNGERPYLYHCTTYDVQTMKHTICRSSFFLYYKKVRKYSHLR